MKTAKRLTFFEFFVITDVDFDISFIKIGSINQIVMIFPKFLNTEMRKLEQKRPKITPKVTSTNKTQYSTRLNKLLNQQKQL